MALANQWGGTTGTSILSALLATLAIAASYRAARCYIEHPAFALATAVLMNSMLLSLACRPHQWTHLGLALLSWGVAAFLSSGRRTALYCLPVLFAAWVNLHGGYAVGLTFLLMVAILKGVDAFIDHDPDRFRNEGLPLLAAFAACLLATLLNPYGVGAWEYAVRIATLKSSTMNVVAEWMPPSIKSDLGLQYFVATAIPLACMAYSRSRPTPSALLGSLALIAAGWSAVRLSLMMPILLVPFAAQALSRTAYYEDVLRHVRMPRLSLPLGALIALLVGGTSVAYGYVDKTAQRFMADRFPVEEAKFLASHQLTSRVLTPPEAGGYLMRNYGMRMSLDTRYDLYGDKDYFAYLFARRGDTGWSEYIARLAPDAILLHQESPLRDLLLLERTYRPVLEGDTFTVMVRFNEHPTLPTVPLKSLSEQVLNDL